MFGKKKEQERLRLEAMKKAQEEAARKAQEAAEAQQKLEAEFMEKLRNNHPIMTRLLDTVLSCIEKDVQAINRPNTVEEVKREWKLFVCNGGISFYWLGYFLARGYYIYYSLSDYNRYKYEISFRQERLPDLTAWQIRCFVIVFEELLAEKVVGVLNNLNVPDSNKNFNIAECEESDVQDDCSGHRCTRKYTYIAKNNNYVSVGSW